MPAARRARWCGERDDRQARLRAAAEAVGFTTDAFGDFVRDWDAYCQNALPPPTRARMQELEGLLGRPWVREAPGGGIYLAVAFEASRDLLPTVLDQLARMPDVTVASRQALNERLVRVIARDLPRLAVLSVLLVLLVLALGLRDWRRVLAAVAAPGLAILTFFGIFGALDCPLNLMSLCVVPLLNGSGTDYGILMAQADGEAGPSGLETRAFGLSAAALTTLAGFAPMAWASYRALAAIGQSVVLAIGAAAVLALLLPPAIAAATNWRS